ncbi:MAG: hypothetical protein GX489_04265 [Firmicutes bacterium]|jgi:hypothetical protein|nr:hypothetical protein [Bacillota bacterium]
MQIPWIAILGPVALVSITAHILYRLITEHIDQRFEELKEWLQENSQTR